MKTFSQSTARFSLKMVEYQGSAGGRAVSQMDATQLPTSPQTAFNCQNAHNGHGMFYRNQYRLRFGSSLRAVVEIVVWASCQSFEVKTRRRQLYIWLLGIIIIQSTNLFDECPFYYLLSLIIIAINFIRVSPTNFAPNSTQQPLTFDEKLSKDLV
jgi:hypothetical protein